MRICTLAIGFIFFIGLKFSIGSNSCDSVPTPYFTAIPFPQEDVLEIRVNYNVIVGEGEECYQYCDAYIDFDNGNLFFSESRFVGYEVEHSFLYEGTYYSCIYYECVAISNDSLHKFEYCDSVRVYRNPTVSVQEENFNGNNDFDIRYNSVTQTLSIKSNDELNSIVQIFNIMGLEVFSGNFVREFSLKLDFLSNNIFFITISNKKNQKVKYIRN